MPIEKKLFKKTALITGASQGLGKQIAIQFVNEGANLILFSRNSKNLIKLKNYLKKIQQPFQKILIKVGDVSLEKDIKNLTEFTFNNFETCEILINNAGVYGPKGKFEKSDFNEWMKTIQTNLVK